MLVGTEPYLRTNKAIDKKICSFGGLVEWRYVVHGHPVVKQGWAHGDNVRARSMVVIRVCGWGALTRGERAPAGDVGGPTEGGRRRSLEVGSPNLQFSPASRPQTFLQNALGDLNSPANLRHS